MRCSSSLALLAATSLVLSSCLDEQATLVGPVTSDPERGDPPAMIGSTGSEVRITEPRDGALLRARVGFTIRVSQQVREGPGQGRGQVQCSANEGSWTNVGDPFPWSKQDTEFEIPDVTLDEDGLLTLRLIFYEQSPERPFLESLHATIHSRGGASTALAAID